MVLPSHLMPLTWGCPPLAGTHPAPSLTSTPLRPKGAPAFRSSWTPMTSEPAHMNPARSFQGLILTLQRFWAEQGCVILRPYDMEMGAGAFHPATTLRALGPTPSPAGSE